MKLLLRKNVTKINTQGAGTVITNNTQHTAIQEIVGGSAGKILTLVAGDDNTEIIAQGSKSISLVGDWQPHDGDSITFVYHMGTWIETCRS